MLFTCRVKNTGSVGYTVGACLLMSNPIVIACLVAVFSWWFFTGIILLLVRYSDGSSFRSRRLYALCSFPFLVAGFLLYNTRHICFSIGSLPVFSWCYACLGLAEYVF